MTAGTPLVLVIDEEPRTALLLKGTAPLTQHKFEVRHAADGVRAFRLLPVEPPDLIVLSAELPGGLRWTEVVDGMRKSGCKAPVILVTRGDFAAAPEALSRGVRDILHKPLTAPALREALASALADVRYQAGGEQVIADLQATVRQAQPAAQPAISDFDVLYAIGRSVTSLNDLEEILHRVVDAAVFITGAEQGSLMLVGQNTGELTVRAAKNFDEKIARTLRLHTADSLAGEVVLTGRARNLSSPEPTKIKTGLLVRSALYVPLKVGGKVIGVLSVDNQRSARPFGARDERLLSAMADYAAIAIDHARLYRDLHARAEALETAYRAVEEASQLKDQMLQNLSHELRTPLVFIKGYVDLLAGGDFGALSAEIMQGLQTLQRRINDLVKIIENALALSEPGQLQLQTVNLAGVVTQEVEAMAAAMQRAGVTVIPDLPDGPLLVIADARQVGLVIRNLLDNAVKFSPRAGLVTVGARPLDAKFVEVIVSDSGVGIPADKIDKVFDRFYQVDGSATRRYGGTGLGLPAAREVIRAHGGEMRVESRLGRGSVFRFTLPRADALAS